MTIRHEDDRAGDGQTGRQGDRGGVGNRSPLARLLKLEEVARILGISIKTVRRRIEAGELPVIRDGRAIRVHPNDLERYIAARRVL